MLVERVKIARGCKSTGAKSNRKTETLVWELCG